MSLELIAELEKGPRLSNMVTAQIMQRAADALRMLAAPQTAPVDVRERFERIYSVEGLTVPEMGKPDRFNRLPNGLYADLGVRRAWHWFNRAAQADPWYVPCGDDVLEALRKLPEQWRAEAGSAMPGAYNLCADQVDAIFGKYA